MGSYKIANLFIFAYINQRLTSDFVQLQKSFCADIFKIHPL